MKIFMVSLSAAVTAMLLTFFGETRAAEAPDAATSAGPALTTLGDSSVLAWAGAAGVSDHGVYYAMFNGSSWTPEADIPGALTTTAPALGTAGGKAYLAITPPGANDRIHYYVSSGTAFESNGMPLCEGEICALTRASPALAGDGSTLYAAWTTPAGEIMVATHSNGLWRFAAAPVPHATTSPTTGPAMAVYDHKLYLAWVAPSGEAVEVVSTPLPLSHSSWSSEPVHIAAHTKVAPALGLIAGVGTGSIETLFLAWTTTSATLGFVYWDGAASQWYRINSPVAIPSGPLTVYSVALNSFVEPGVHECRLNELAFTTETKPHGHVKVHTRQVGGPCP
jgi:hypothetical protein